MQVRAGEETFEVVPTFQYLGDVIGESGGCTTSAHITTGWKSLRQLLSIITNHVILLKTRVISSAPVL